MDHQSNGVYRLLEEPRFYERFQRLLGARGARRRFSVEFVRPFKGARVLDIGCGTGSLLDDLPPDVTYVGFDLNVSYIAAARRRYAGRGSFHAARIGEETVPLDGQPPFDRIVAKGILHHLSDDDVYRLLAVARRHLAPGGVFVCSDPARHDGQPLVARLLLSMDRGRRVRTPEQYRLLLGAHFGTIEATLVTDLLRVPYSHYIVRAGI
jgi:SAM-dependent methyltransferase